MPDHRFPIEIVHRLWGKMETVALADPNPRSAIRMLQETEDGQLRGVAHGDLVLVFPARQMTHGAARDALRLPQVFTSDGGCDFWIVRDGEEPDTGDWSTSDMDLVRDGHRLILGADRDVPGLARMVAWFGSEPKTHPVP